MLYFWLTLCASASHAEPFASRHQVHVYGALPLRSLSRLWGYMNSLELPIWFRPTGFRLYAWLFNCNLDEVEHSDDLRVYVSLGDFFYRKLKPGVRPIANASLVGEIIRES